MPCYDHFHCVSHIFWQTAPQDLLYLHALYKYVMNSTKATKSYLVFLVNLKAAFQRVSLRRNKCLCDWSPWRVSGIQMKCLSHCWPSSNCSRYLFSSVFPSFKNPSTCRHTRHTPAFKYWRHLWTNSSCNYSDLVKQLHFSLMYSQLERKGVRPCVWSDPNPRPWCPLAMSQMKACHALIPCKPSICALAADPSLFCTPHPPPIKLCHASGHPWLSPWQ